MIITGMHLYVDYPATFIQSGNGYTVEFPDLPGCVAKGDSFEEARVMAEDAAKRWIQTSIEDGEVIPTPKSLDSFRDNDVMVTLIKVEIRSYVTR